MTREQGNNLVCNKVDEYWFLGSIWTQEERAYLVGLVNDKKKYGLVWEDKPEDVEEQLRTQLPILREVIEKRILANDLTQTVKGYR